MEGAGFGEAQTVGDLWNAAPGLLQLANGDITARAVLDQPKRRPLGFQPAPQGGGAERQLLGGRIETQLEAVFAVLQRMAQVGE